ncbi:hypothetical protein IJ674_01705 [bacterium]|nr:hypothetical protein [bacterium]
MYNYYFYQIRNKNNNDEQGYELRRDKEHLETLLYNIDNISAKELKQKKMEFFNFICSKYTDIDRKNLLMIFAYVDDDMLEYYKSEYPIKELKKSGNWVIKDCPKRTERYYKKLTEDKKVFVEVALQKFRQRFGYKVDI